MGYYVIGINKDKKYTEYSILDSNTKNIATMNNNMLITNKHIASSITGVMFKDDGDVKLQADKINQYTEVIFNPITIENGKIKGNKTLVYIDLVKGMCGVVNHKADIYWVSISDLEKMELKDLYNGTIYNKHTMELDLSYYIVNGKIDDTKIILNGLIKKLDKEESKSIELNESNKNTEKNSIEVINRDINKENTKIEVNKSTNTIVDNLYIEILKILKDTDIITMPKSILKEVRFKIIHNLDKSINMDRLVSIGSIKINKIEMIVIVHQEFDKDDIRVQMVRPYEPSPNKDYSIESIIAGYNKWRNNSKYLSL